jgi:hypothetical protein
MALKEKAILAILAMVGVYALAVVAWFVTQQAAWKKSAKAYQTACENYEKECKLIAQKQKWFNAYEEEKAAMPMFEEGKSTGTTWQRKMEELAVKHHITISQRQAGKEDAAGDVLELSIEVKKWEGALESLVQFLHELENTDEGMFDVRSLVMRPSSKKGYLTGSFVVTCAYMRKKD